MITTPLKFSKFPYGTVDIIQNPNCGKQKGSEVHFFINILKYSHLNENFDMISIDLGNVSRLILGLKHIKLHRIDNGEERIILKVRTGNILILVSF